jgi:hypothetical protein
VQIDSKRRWLRFFAVPEIQPRISQAIECARGDDEFVLVKSDGANTAPAEIELNRIAELREAARPPRRRDSATARATRGLAGSDSESR